jgi:hypothetical protein
MKIKFGSLVVNGSGKIGGHVVSHNKGGSYMRTKVKPVNPQTLSQVNVRARFSTNSKGWNSITAAQRLAWNAALTLQRKMNNMGESILLSGKALYSKVNQNLTTIGTTAISAPVTPGAGFSLTTFSATSVHGTNVTTLTFTSAIPATHKLVIMATPPMSAGITFIKNKLRIIKVSPSTDVSPLVVTTDYVNKFGSIPAAGALIYFRAYAIEIASGFASQAVQCVATVS